MRVRLNDRFVQTVKPPPTGRLDIMDTEARGLVLRVTDAGVRSWAVRYRPKGQGQKRETVGVYPDVSLAYARQRARDVLAAAARGIDLPAQEATEREAARREAGRPATVDALLKLYVDEHCNIRQRRPKLTERLFEMHVAPAIGKKLLVELRRADVVELLDDLQNKKGFAAQVNRVRSQVVAALNWAVEREWLETNPAAAIKKRKIEAARERVLTHDELRAIWCAASGLNDPAGAFVRALILTGQRRDEIRCMEWAEVNSKAKTWTLPARRNKGKRDHVLPLSEAMVELLDGLTKLGVHVFTVSGKKPYAGTRHLKEILDRESNVGGWVLHDLRRTMRSGLSELRVPEEVAERIMNHGQKGLVRTYNRHLYLSEMRAALDAWAKHVAVIVGDGRDAPNVVPLARQGTAG